MPVNYSVLLYSESVIALVGASNKEKTTDNFSKYSIPNIIKHRWHVCPGHLMSCAAPGSAPRPECRVAAPAPSGGLCHLLISATWGALGHSVSPLASSIPASHLASHIRSLFIWSQVVHLHILEHNYVTHVPPLYIIKTLSLSLHSSYLLSHFCWWWVLTRVSLPILFDSLRNNVCPRCCCICGISVTTTLELKNI